MRIALANCLVIYGCLASASMAVAEEAVTPSISFAAPAMNATAVEVVVENDATAVEYLASSPTPAGAHGHGGGHTMAGDSMEGMGPLFHTTGAPVPGDGAVYFHFPEDPPSKLEEAIDVVPGLITRPNEWLGNFAARVLHAERDELHTALDEEAIGIQYVPPRPPLVIEYNDLFLGPGELAEGRSYGPFGPVFRPGFWVWGEFRTAIQHFDNGGPGSITEWASRLDLFAQLNLTGTERFLFAVRPLDRESGDGTRREFASFDLQTGEWLDGLNFQPQSAFFEGDFGEILPMLDPYDSKGLDYGFAIGRMPLLAQQGLLLSEDIIDAVTITRNTLNNNRNLNRRITGVFGWGEVSRSSPIAGNPGVLLDQNSQLFAILTETDYFRTTVNADVAYVTGDDVQGDLVAFGLSGIQRHYFHHNTYNTSLHVLASFPTEGETPYANQGELLFAQTSWTPHHYYDLIYVNGFVAIDEYTPVARGPLAGLTGLTFAPVGLGRYGAPMAVRTNNTFGAALGYQWFFCDTRKQLIWETGGAKEYEGPANLGAISTLLRYQSAHGQHKIFVVEGFLGKQEGRDISLGSRVECRVKF